MKKDIITNYKVYDLEETLVASGYAMIEEYDEETVKKEALDSVDAYINNKEDSLMSINSGSTTNFTGFSSTLGIM